MDACTDAQVLYSASSLGLDDTCATRIAALRVPRRSLQDHHTAVSQLQARSGVSQRHSVGQVGSAGTISPGLNGGCAARVGASRTCLESRQDYNMAVSWREPVRRRSGMPLGMLEYSTIRLKG
jgi:hypothetical protein